MKQRWLQIEVQVSPEEADDVRAIMARWAGAAVALEEPAPQGNSLQDRLPWRVSAYLPEGPELATTRYQLLNALWLTGRVAAGGALEAIERWTDEDEWYARWKEYYKPLRVGSLLILPAWDKLQPQEGEIAVRIDPGQAFGTGLHVTTRQALLALQRADCRGRRILDLGTGSGILAIAAALLGAAHVTALDTDPQAVKSARQNVAANATEEVVHVLQGSVGPGQTAAPECSGFDVALANIVASVHCDLAEAIVAVVKPGGTIILGGIVADRAATVTEAFAARAAGLVDSSEEEGWSILTLRNAS